MSGLHLCTMRDADEAARWVGDKRRFETPTIGAAQSTSNLSTHEPVARR